MKICVPMTGSDPAVLEAEALEIRRANCDLAEWRADCFDGTLADGAEALTPLLASIKAALGPIPLIFTFRTAEEGGRRAIGETAYQTLLLTAARSGLADIIDLEFFRIGSKKAGIADEAGLARLIAEIRLAGAMVLLSSHDFERTPPESELENRLRRMEHLGADIVKLAVMPRCRADVAALLRVTERIKAAGCRAGLITISMGDLGKESRLAGGPLGTDVTFGTLGQASAPGQLSVPEIRAALAERDRRAK